MMPNFYSVQDSTNVYTKMKQDDAWVMVCPSNRERASGL